MKSGVGVKVGGMGHYRGERERREAKRRNVARIVCLIVVAAMLLALVIPAIYAGL